MRLPSSLFCNAITSDEYVARAALMVAQSLSSAAAMAAPKGSPFLPTLPVEEEYACDAIKTTWPWAGI
eukprot:scaffold26047_cov55-Attheya_sp.AAC.9